MGPMTGRGAGYCADYDVPGYANPMPGRRFGMGRGWGRGRGRGRFGYAPFWDVPRPAQEREFLKAQAEGLKRQLDAISQRISELEQE
jgi:hypothetical protein